MSNTSKTDWARLEAMKDAEIDMSDIPELDHPFLQKAELRLPRMTVENAVVAGINRFIGEGLITRGGLDKVRYETENGLTQLNNDIAHEVAAGSVGRSKRLAEE